MLKKVIYCWRDRCPVAKELLFQGREYKTSCATPHTDKKGIYSYGKFNKMKNMLHTILKGPIIFIIHFSF